MGCDCRFRRLLRAANVAFNPERTVYMDYNATTPVDPRTIGAFDKMCRREWGNPSSLHSCGVQAEGVLENFRATIASYFGCDATGINFCASGSEAIHAALWGVLSNPQKKRTLIVPVVEHSSLMHPARQRRMAGESVVILPVGVNGQISVPTLEAVVKKCAPALFAYSPVNHETGALQPVREISRALKGLDCLQLIDGVQAAARLSPKEWVPYCDMFVVSAHKLYAPKGSAFLWKKSNLKLRPFRFGGRQEGALFPGTENSAGIAAFAAAVELLRDSFVSEQRRLDVLLKEGLAIFKEKRVEYKLESPESRVAGVVALSLPWVRDMERLFSLINSKLICLSRFSACTNSVTGFSRVLLAMGSLRKNAQRSFRIALGRWSKRDDFLRLAAVLREAMDKNI